MQYDVNVSKKVDNLLVNNWFLHTSNRLVTSITSKLKMKPKHTFYWESLLSVLIEALSWIKTNNMNKYNICEISVLNRSKYTTKITGLEFTVSIFGVAKLDKERNLFIWTLLTRKTRKDKLLYLIEVAWKLSAYFTSILFCNQKHFLILYDFKMSTCLIVPVNL